MEARNININNFQSHYKNGLYKVLNEISDIYKF
jgi:hypothetical protein